MDYDFTFRAIYSYLGQLYPAAATTISLSLLTIAASLAIGAVMAVARQNSRRWISFLAAAYVEFFRNIPLLVTLYLFYFALPQAGLRLSSFESAVVGMSINAGAYMTEILRAGLNAVPYGQREAAYSQGMTYLQMLRHVVAWQVLQTIYAPLGNQIISIILASSLASAIAVDEVTSWMQTTGASSFRFFETFLVAAVVYILLCQAVNLLRMYVGKILLPEGR